MESESMIAFPERENAVERDMDLIRDLLLMVEANPEMDGTHEFQFASGAFPDRSPEEVSYHLKKLIEAGFLHGNQHTALVSSLTWNGHEFLDNIKDPGIWGKTKKQLSGLPGVALTVVAQIAQAEIKKHLGLP